MAVSPHVQMMMEAAEGGLDPTFDGDGLLTIDFANRHERCSDVAVQPDGKIVVAGETDDNGLNDFALTRLNTDGSLDPTFGSSGKVLTDFGQIRDFVRSVAILADGKIVTVGSLVAPTTSHSDMVVARYDALAPHTVTFFLRGHDVPGTAGGFTMNQTAPSPQFLAFAPHSTPRWFSDPVVNGTFLSGATVQVVLPCTGGIALPKTVRLASTDPGGGNEQTLVQVSEPFRLCVRQTVTVPVTTPVTLANRRLKLTIASNVVVHLPLQLGNHTTVSGTTFVGAP